MTTPDLVLAIDCSTTACKVVALTPTGREIAAGKSPISLIQRGAAGWEQNASQWWSALCAASLCVTKQISPARIAAVCITHQRETFVVCDRDGAPRAPAIVWMDERAGEQVARYRARAGALHARTGKPLCMTPSFFKALWLRETHPEVFAADVVLTDVHGYLAWRLAGVWATSLACADPTGLVDMSAGTWAESLLGELGLDERGVPALVEVGSQVGAVTANASEATGISAGTPLFAGAGDGQCAGLGAGITGLDTAYLNLGTAMVSGVCSPRYQTSLAYRTLFAAYPGHFQLETDLKGGTFTLNWLASTILGASSPSERLAALEREAVDLDPGVDGLYCVPYFCGVMNPYWDDSAGGTFVGLRGSHGPAHLYRAILEGLCFEQRLHSDAVQEATGVPIEGFITMGGGSRSDLFCQIVADVTGRSVVRSGTAEATALGAGILAAVGAGLHPDVPAAVAEMTSHGRAFAPGDSRARYDALYAGYKRIYPALAADQG